VPPRLKVDDDLPADVAKVFRTAGYDAATVVEQEMRGYDDDRISAAVQSEGRILVTADKGFADATTCPPGAHAGVVLFRLEPESRCGYIEPAKRLVDTIEISSLTSRCVVEGRGLFSTQETPSMAEPATETLDLHLEVPGDLARLSLPEGVDRRLHVLLDKQDRGEPLTDDERAEAEGLVDLSELLSLLKLRSSRHTAAR
jgi:predicted nuclease of predicted toxin-antitoxin system